jgi:hypothetical protein
MRKVVIAACALTAAVPAAAQPAESWDVEAALERVDFDRVGAVVERMVGAFMELPIGGIAAAVDPLGRRSGIYPDDTLGSYTLRNDPDAERRLRANIRGATRQAEVASRAVARMMPVLQSSLDRMRGALAEALEGLDSE